MFVLINNLIMKKIIEATYHLLLFIPYTDMPRWLEFGYGMMAWANIILVVFAIA